MKRLTLLPLLLLALAACAPFRTVVVDVVNELGGSHGVLSYSADPAGVTITPGDTVLLDVRLDVQGFNLTTTADCIVNVTEHIICTWPLLDTVTIVPLTGDDVTVSISFKRPGDTAFRLEHLGE